LSLTPAPADATCSTGSRTALIRGPRVHFIGAHTDQSQRLWTGSRIGYSDQAVLCGETTWAGTGNAPTRDCFPPQKLIRTGKVFPGPPSIVWL
jgi:hypothetical protein